MPSVMSGSEEPTHIHIGAGSFGLGMVVPLCQRAGFSTRIISRNSSRAHHSVLQEQGKYVLIEDDSPQEITAPVHYFRTDNDPEAVSLLARRSIRLVTTSVRADNLAILGPLLARAIEERQANNAPPLSILACENMRNNSRNLRQIIEPLVNWQGGLYLRNQTFFHNTVVDRICARIRLQSPLIVEVPAESYYSWVVHVPAQSSPAIEQLRTAGVITTVNTDAEFKAYEVRKYWCLNGSHLAAAAYAFNFDPSIRFLADALQVEHIRRKVQALQRELETAFLLYAERHGLKNKFPQKSVREYLDDTLARFRKDRTDSIDRILKHSLDAPELVIQDLIDSLAEAGESPATAEGASRPGAPGMRIVSALNKKLPGVLWLLDLHEVLERVTERFIEPQSEILAFRKEIPVPEPEMLAFHKSPKPIVRLELDDALRAVVLATTNYSRAQYQAIRQELTRHGRTLDRNP